MIVHKEQLPALAEALVAYAKERASGAHATTFALEGDLGAGKTTLMQHMARALGVRENVVSPTFVLMKRYQTADPIFTHLVHIDAYRIEREEELAPLHLGEVFEDKHALVCVEWPEKLRSALPDGAIPLVLTPFSEDERGMVVEGELEPYLEARL